MKRLIFLLSAATLFGSTLIGCDRKPSVDEPSVDQQQKQGLPYGKATKYGLFHERGRGVVQDNATTSTGKIIRGATLEFAENTDRIPLHKGVHFGYRYWLKFAPEQARPAFKRVLIHPEMTLPNGSKVIRSERTIRKKATHGIVTAIDAYALSEDYELVEGEWTFQLWHGDKMLAEQKFTTYWLEEEKEEENSVKTPQPAATKEDSPS
jgi:hypothetical protein